MDLKKQKLYSKAGSSYGTMLNAAAQTTDGAVRTGGRFL